jgi:hypothetical protein
MNYPQQAAGYLTEGIHHFIEAGFEEFDPERFRYFSWMAKRPLLTLLYNLPCKRVEVVS